MKTIPVATSDSAQVLTKASRRAAAELGISQRDLAAIIGVSPATVSRFARGGTLDPKSKEAELALQLLRVYRSLDALLGGDREKCRAWLWAHNAHLAGVPAELLSTVPGLVHVAEYLDALRGHG
jgi:transcriptional regulator with XRE-family HTH domain